MNSLILIKQPHSLYFAKEYLNRFFQGIFNKKQNVDKLWHIPGIYKKLFDEHTAVKLIINPVNGDILDANNAAVKFYGWSKKQLKSMKISQINLLSEDQVISEMKKAILNQRNYFEFQHRLSDNSVKDVEVYSSKIETKGKIYLHSIIHDITARKTAELIIQEKNKKIETQNEQYIHINEEYRQINEELLYTKEQIEKSEKDLKRQNEIFSILLKTLKQGIFMVEAPSGKPLLSNEAALTILGRGIIQNADKSNLSEVYKFFKGDTYIPYPNHETPIVLGLNGISACIDDMVIERPDGTRIYLEVYGSPVKDEFGRIWASMVSFSDITARKKTEEELIRAKEKAIESEKLKSSFLQNMSHEIRTPLNAIMGFSDLLKDAFEDKKQLEKYAQIISLRSSDLLDIINDILDFSKIESGQMNIHSAECNIDNLFNELFDFFNEYQKRLHKENIQFSLANTTPNVLTSFITDEVKLRQILINLITNAIKFTEKGAITGGCKLLNNETIQFFIEDTGAGIPPEKLKYIFERFTQIEHNGKPGGTGLGLPIVKGLVSLLGGEISVDSMPGQGSRFIFNLPYQQPDYMNSINSENAKTKLNNIKKQTVLIVEDDIYNSLYLKEIVNSIGLNSLEASNGKDAIELALNNNVDLVLLDIRLPDLNGYEVSKQIRQFKSDLKIIAQTAFASQTEMNKAIEAGCNDYIFKPIKKDVLLRTMNKYLV